MAEEFKTDPEVLESDSIKAHEYIKWVGRKCGECYACCVYLGIQELKKWPGQSCKHLDGAHGPCTRCTIYERRPAACQNYYCGWLAGIGPDDEFRPDKCGVLITYYPPDEANGYLQFSATLHIIDEKKSGTITDLDSKLNTIIANLIDNRCNDIRILLEGNKAGGRALHLHNGVVYAVRILKSSGYEDLSFAQHNEPLGRYVTATKEPSK